MHRTLKEETAHPPRASIKAQQKAFNEFKEELKEEFNWERPHEAHGGKCPSDIYVPSARPYNQKMSLEVDYPAQYAARCVKHNGGIKWRGKDLHIGQALQGEFILWIILWQSWMITL